MPRPVRQRSDRRLAESCPPSPAVGYQSSPKGGQSCANCRLFEAPNACRSVDGIINGKAWCKIYVKA
ncbi:MAG: high-potential iron-sulfur protein [Hyphomicrobiales bacterium]